MKTASRTTNLARRVSLVNLFTNLCLCLFKLAVGVFARSAAMISEGVNSASDVLSNLIVLVGLKVSGKAADDQHPYGHDRFECVASILLACILFATGGAIGWAGVTSILSSGSLQAPGKLALYAAVVNIAVKEWLYFYTIRAAKRLNSLALRAAAWDHQTDALCSVGTFIGVLGARLGLRILDPIASLIICLCILKVAIDIFREAIDRTVDRSCDDAVVETLRRAVLAQEGVRGLDLIRTRQFGSGIYVDLEISADGEQSLTDAHDIAERVHHAVEAAEPAVRHCMVHVNPAAGSSSIAPQEEHASCEPESENRRRPASPPEERR